MATPLETESQIDYSSTAQLPENTRKSVKDNASDHVPGNSAYPLGDEAGGSINSDDAELEAMGYKPELARGFSGLMSFSFCFVAVNVIASLSVSFGSALSTGGPAVMSWYWIVASMLNVVTGAAMGEICSRYPSAGSVYHWSAQLATAEYGPIMSYITGWFNFLGNLAGDASFASGFAWVLCVTIKQAGGADYTSTETVADRVPQVGFSIAILVFWTILNILKVEQQGYVNITAMITQIFGSLAIAATIIACAPSRQNATFVFTETYNGTGIESFAYVALIACLSPCFSMAGYEAGAHMAEETRNSSKSAPHGIVLTCICSGFFGFIYLMSLLFSMQDLEATVNSDDATVQIFFDAAGYYGGIILASILILNLFFAGVSSLTVTSRIGFAMVRDGSLPGSSFFYHVNQATKIPIRLVLLTAFLDVVLLLLPLVNTTAFDAILSITVIGFNISYGIPIFLRITTARNRFTKGPFHLGSFSIVVGAIACFWLFFTSLLLFFPTSYPIDAESFNYTCAVVGGTAIIGTLYWFLVARHSFVGPRRQD
eukprot:comp23503_c0_seq1/m.39378 comp23503_c0_seq1/g.39378  ORF comp23503_c0_seq1/g.39378 comp23503_c0_seq1/m.39378 type:complete len:543 (-) comp23503_c0_seq1:392-2020(-)